MPTRFAAITIQVSFERVGKFLLPTTGNVYRNLIKDRENHAGFQFPCDGMRFAFIRRNHLEWDKNSIMKNSLPMCRDFEAPRVKARSQKASSPRLRPSIGPLCLAICALILYGCSASASSASRGETPAGPQAANLSPEQCASGAVIQATSDQQDYHIQRGDRLAINFYLNPEFNSEAPVAPDGTITLPLIGSIPAAGMTPSDLAQQIDKGYLSELRSPDAAVIVKNMPGRQIYVQGQVNHPGAFPLEPGMTALQALADAGGITQDAADSNVVLIRRDACGRPAGERLDLASAVNNPDKGEDAALMPYDVLVVPRSRIANMDLFVQQYIRNLLPVQPYFSMTPGL